MRGFLEFVNDLEVLSPWGPGAGVRLQAWVDATAYDGGLAGNAGDRDQLAVEPYIMYRPPFVGPANIPVFARLGFILPVDNGLFNATISSFNTDPSADYFVLRAMVGGRF